MAQNSTGAIFLTLVLACASSAAASPPPIGTIEVTPARVRARPGDQVTFRVRGAELGPRALLLIPGGGTRPLTLELVQPGEHRVRVTLPSDGAGGLYLIHVWNGEPHQPSALGKAAVVAGPVVMDFFLPAYVDRSAPQRDLAAYLDDFQGLGGNTLIAHALITPDQAYFPSAIARTSVVRGSPADVVEHLLVEADRRGLAVFLSVSWDMTRQAPYRQRMAQITALMAELFALYAGHPSLAGFYSYQEGSGTYYVPYVREFTGHVKKLNPGLLSACAPFVDDPLVAGYLSTVETLDVMIFQGMVMGSYRTDNRKRFPLRRARDFAALGIGAKWLQDKIAVTHVELFGYLENRPDPAIIAASYDNIFGQIASVATAPAADGIALFAYHPHIWSARRDPRVQRSRQAGRRRAGFLRAHAAGDRTSPQPARRVLPVLGLDRGAMDGVHRAGSRRLPACGHSGRHPSLRSVGRRSRLSVLPFSHEPIRARAAAVDSTGANTAGRIGVSANRQRSHRCLRQSRRGCHCLWPADPDGPQLRSRQAFRRPGNRRQNDARSTSSEPVRPPRESRSLLPVARTGGADMDGDDGARARHL